MIPHDERRFENIKNKPKIKNIFLLAFSETLREASYTRNNEFKLFRMQNYQNYKPDAFSIFVQKLKLDGEFSNIFHTKNNILTGKVGGEMMFSDSKGNMLLALQKLLNISYDNTLTVGDGANDLSMFKYAKNRVAFCSKEILKKEANIIIDEKDLRLILDKL